MLFGANSRIAFFSCTVMFVIALDTVFIFVVRMFCLRVFCDVTTANSIADRSLSQPHHKSLRLQLHLPRRLCPRPPCSLTRAARPLSAPVSHVFALPCGSEHTLNVYRSPARRKLQKSRRHFCPKARQWLLVSANLPSFPARQYPSASPLTRPFVTEPTAPKMLIRTLKGFPSRWVQDTHQPSIVRTRILMIPMYANDNEPWTPIWQSNCRGSGALPSVNAAQSPR